MDKFKKFLTVGSVAVVVSLSTFATIMPQDSWYDNAITQPVEAVQSYFGFENTVKNKYENFIKEDKEFLLKSGLSNEIVDTDVILKHQTTIDKAFYPLMKLGHFLFQTSKDMQIESQNKYEGISSHYHLSTKNSNQKVLNEYIMLGINALESKDSGVYKALYEIFNKDEQQLTSFVFFHELGHKIGLRVFSQDAEVGKIFDKFEQEKGIKLSKEDKEIISSQYSETFSDSFAISMMKKKYPELDFEQTKDLVAGFRLKSGNATHLTSPGLVSLNKTEQSTELKDILDSAKHSALITTQFYSEIDFSKAHNNEKQAEGRDTPVKLVELDAASVRDKITAAREKFTMNQDPHAAGLKL